MAKPKDHQSNMYGFLSKNETVYNSSDQMLRPNLFLFLFKTDCISNLFYDFTPKSVEFRQRILDYAHRLRAPLPINTRLFPGHISSRSQTSIFQLTPWVIQSNLNAVSRMDCALPSSVEKRSDFSAHSHLPIPANGRLDLPVFVWSPNHVSHVPRVSGAHDNCVVEDNLSRSQINFSAEKPVSISSSDSCNEQIEIVNSLSSGDEADLQSNANREFDIEKPGEYSVLADELASLTTFNQLEKNNISVPAASNELLKSSVLSSRKPHQGRKRRCLRILAPSEPNLGSSTDKQPISAHKDHILPVYSNTRDITSSVQRTISQNHVYGKSNHFHKAYEKSHQNALLCLPTSVASQVFRSSNSSSISFSRLSQAQKRHATASKRSKLSVYSPSNLHVHILLIYLLCLFYPLKKKLSKITYYIIIRILLNPYKQKYSK
ncbi:Non-canonical poly(A) RNA polymerase PAPD5 [Schistosoma japonicum]|nr:Non-canonical poly(A) RNA polymerase PAPD5 [Schistosoma japonicum]